MHDALQPNMQSTEQLQDLLKHTFPAITYGFAYGSAVFRQAGLYQDGSSKDAGPMIDMIFVVDDPQLWHQQVYLIKPTAQSE